MSVAADEGSQPVGLRPMSISRLDPGQYVDQDIVARMRAHSMRRAGLRVGDVLDEIERRRSTEPGAARGAGSGGDVSLPASERRVPRRDR